MLGRCSLPPDSPRKHRQKTKKAALPLTEREGFEPPGLLTQLFSRQPQSTTLPSLRNYYTTVFPTLEEAATK